MTESNITEKMIWAPIIILVVYARFLIITI